MRRSILLISYYFPPLGMAGLQRPLGLAKYLFRLGWKVYVLTVKPIAYWEYDPTLLEDFPQEIPIFRAGSADFARLAYRVGKRKRESSGAWAEPKKLVWDTKLGFVPFAYFKAARLINRFKIEVVWTTSPPPSIHLVGYGLKRRSSVSWFADFRDPWGVEAPEENCGLWSGRQKRLKRLLTAADGVTAANERLKNFLEPLAKTSKVAAVFNGFDPEIKVSSSNSPQKIFTMAYGGTLSPSTDPYIFPAALARWKKEKKRAFRLILVGRIIGLPVEARLAELGLAENVEITGYLPHRAALEKLAQADLLLLFLSQQEKYRLTVPAKIFEYVGLGKPTLAVVSQNGAVANFFSTYPVGNICSREDEIMEKLEFYYRQWESGARSLLPETLCRQFGWDKQAERLSNVIESRLK